ncbi:hypothetical protein QQY66_04695 [Streptomyces sp. DG2A-72]|uniref:hypothetical protein n=1 Tax=Streptomyces sp. DG2A-72 TaxID=3051386 RepID=UPI00265BD1D3|nr:hypothetical protein [Streptomyces sp. DG2A-72]MDO0931012.1 hypothetical protein [Streptomyces sp. DG2A-72]
MPHRPADGRAHRIRGRAQRLAEAMVADPGPALRSLHERILRQDSELLPVPVVAVR